MWFPTVEQIIRIHDDILAETGGEPGVLNRSVLEGTVQRVRWGPFPRGGSFVERAALLLRGIAQAHPFVDGNKRTALEVVDTFFDKNGRRLSMDPDDGFQVLLAVARGEVSLLQIESFLRAHAPNR